MLTTVAPTSTSCMRSSYWRRNAFQPGSFASSASLLSPYCCWRACTSAALSPVAGSTSSCAQTASAASRYHSVRSSPGAPGGAGTVVAVMRPTSWSGPSYTSG